jgi:hypothetical protein
MPTRTFHPVILLPLILLLCAGSAVAQDRNVEINGFILGNFTGRTTGLDPEGQGGNDYLLAEERVRLDIYAWADATDASAQIKTDFLHDALTREFDVDIREAYFDYSTGSIDLRLGRQIVTWGVGDLIFINDVFPKDWVSFFSGRPLEYLKSGVDGVRTRYYTSFLNFDFVAIPRFDPDRLPTPDRFFLYDPFATIGNRSELLPDTGYENTELALRLYRRFLGFDTSFYAYRGFWRSPGVILNDPANPTGVTYFYPELSVFGMSAQGNGFGGLLSLEGGYYDSRDDRRGTNPLVSNSQFRFLVGYQRQLSENVNLGLQYYTEIMADHEAYLDSLPEGSPEQEEYRDTVTLRLERFLKYHTWKITFFGFFSPAERDYLLQPSIFHKFSDEFALTFGANIFGGEEKTSFLGQFDRNDNVYLSARFDF